jgi:hypothetical protein
MAGGGVVGALALSFATSWFDATFQPAEWRDGQYVFVYLATIPIGAALGAIAALAWHQRQTGDLRAAGQVAAAGGIAGVVLSLPAALEVGFGFSIALLVMGLVGWKNGRTAVNTRPESGQSTSR